MTRSLREQSQTLPACALSLFQSACNWTQNLIFYGSGCNKPHLWKHNQVFGGFKTERRGAASHFAFFEEWLSSCFCRSVFAFPRVCLYFWKQQEHTWGKAKRDVFLANWALLQFLLCHLSAQILRGQQKPDWLAPLKVLAFLLHFRSVSW